MIRFSFPPQNPRIRFPEGTGVTGHIVFEIIEDDLSGEGTIALLRIHLAGMRANSPPESVFALDLSGLKIPEVTVWTVRQGEQVIGIGALKKLDSSSGELKSMRTHPNHLRQGIAALLLEHMIATARKRGWNKLSLETGSGPAFEPALNLYRNRGFADGPPFSDYEPSPFNQFLHLSL
jgi:putative acetyltransferase